MKQETFVIVGASMAGAKAAETLRAEGTDGRIVLIGDEPDRLRCSTSNPLIPGRGRSAPAGACDAAAP